MSEWISIKDEMPSFNRLVLVIIYTNGKYYIPFIAKWNGERFRSDEDDEGVEDYTNNITHWMPLPQPPTTTPNETRTTN